MRRKQHELFKTNEINSAENLINNEIILIQTSDIMGMVYNKKYKSRHFSNRIHTEQLCL